MEYYAVVCMTSSVQIISSCVLYLLKLGVEVELVLSYQSLQLLQLIVQNGVIEFQTRHLVPQQHEGNRVRGRAGHAENTETLSL